MNAEEPAITFRVAKHVLRRISRLGWEGIVDWKKTDAEIREEIRDLARRRGLYSRRGGTGAKKPLKKMIVLYW